MIANLKNQIGLCVFLTFSISLSTIGIGTAQKLPLPELIKELSKSKDSEKSNENKESSPKQKDKTTEPNIEELSKTITKYSPKDPKPLWVGNHKPALVIPIHGTIDLGLPPFIERSLQEHPEAEVIILEVDTLGGRVDAAIQIRDMLLSESRPVIAYVYRRAISAGALISFAADYIVFSPGSTMGAATPIQLDNGQAKAVGEKMVSYFRSEMRATAEANDRDGDLAEAMVDADKELGGVSKKGKLLTLTNKMAEELGVADAVVDSPAELYRILGVDTGRIIRTKESWSENFVRMITDPTLSGMLMSIGMLGIMLELYTPGIGFAGILGFLSLFLFFLGHKFAGLAGSEELLIVILGIILLAAEVFIIPGFGIAGIMGILFLGIGLVTSMGELPAGILWDYAYFEDPVKVFIYALFLTIILAIILAKFLPKSSFGSWLVLKEDLGTKSAEEQKLAQNQLSDGSSLVQTVQVGDNGETTTPLRLSGKAEINGQVIDVISRDEYLEKEQKVTVVEVGGSRIVVIKQKQ